MLPLLSPIFLLEIFCLYHAYSNNAPQKYYYLIVIFPLFGCLLYLYHTFYSQQNIDNISEEVKHVLNDNYKIDKLEKELNFSDTVAKKMELANEYTLIGNHNRALILLKSCLENPVYDDDIGLLKKVVKSSYLNEDYQSAIDYGSKIKDTTAFNKSDEKVAYAWSFFYIKNDKKANELFEEMNIRFGNYPNRLEYAKFLKLTERPEEAKEKLSELLGEIESMDRQEKRHKKDIRRAIENFSREF